MKPKNFLSQLDHDGIVAAIAASEKKSSGEILVYISHRAIDDPIAAAVRRFEKFGMHKGKHRNAVLIYIAPKSQRFAVIGDKAIHEKCGETFWKEVTAIMERHLKAGTPTQAILAAVGKIGETLAEHFPRSPGEKESPAPDVAEGA